MIEEMRGNKQISWAETNPNHVCRLPAFMKMEHKLSFLTVNFICWLSSKKYSTEKAGGNFMVEKTEKHCFNQVTKVNGNSD